MNSLFWKEDGEYVSESRVPVVLLSLMRIVRITRSNVIGVS